jgi:RimJ/RimL family protein N-acetyltransferase
MSNASHEIRDKGNRKNFPGFDYPLEFCPMRPKHKPAMIKAVWSSHQQLRGYIGWAKYARSWDAKTISKFVDDHINAPLPNQHFVFLIGKEIVGVGSLVGAYTNHDAQIALWVTTNYQGKGIGKAIVQTLEYLAWHVWGYPVLFYEHDATNEFSKKLPQKCGFTLSHTRNIEKSADNESGYWFSWRKDRPKDLPDAIIQGRPVGDFTTP